MLRMVCIYIGLLDGVMIVPFHAVDLLLVLLTLNMLYMFRRVMEPGVFFSLLFYAIIYFLGSTISEWSVNCPINGLFWGFLALANL